MDKMGKKLDFKKIREFSYQITKLTIENSIIIPLLTCKHFKIGKTGMSLQERLNEPDYNGTYSYIKKLHSSSSITEISRLERDLILRFMNDYRCDNVRTTDKDEMRESGKYILYLVWK